jgi:Transglycosylase-like domain/Putative peptidoglycan binding domain
MSTTQADIASPIPWRRSLRRSRERRLAAARARRRRIRGRSVAIVLAIVMTVGAGAALAAGGSGPGLLKSGSQGSTIAAVQRALGIGADGVYGPRTRQAVMAFQRVHGLIVDGIVGPQTLNALGLGGSDPPTSGAGSGESTSELSRIAQCESGGNPNAVSPNGQYRGKYQFSRDTWRSLGGSGDPAAAPETEQDRMAELLLERAGTSAWPVCGRS